LSKEPITRFMPATPGAVAEMYREQAILISVNKGSGAAGSPETAANTITATMRYSIMRNVIDPGDLRLLYDDGTTALADSVRPTSTSIRYEFASGDKPMKGFLYCRPHVLRVRLRLPDLKGLPEENRNCRDILELKYASLSDGFQTTV